MNRVCVFVVVLMGIVTLGMSCSSKPPKPEKTLADWLMPQIDSFKTVCIDLQALMKQPATTEASLQGKFMQARAAYKNIEWATEYFLPATARAINGPPVQEVEMSGLVIEPAGLQVIEGMLFPKYDTVNRQTIAGQLDIMARAADQYLTYFQHIDILDWQVLDAARLEVFRIETMGITGFDDPLTLQCLSESAIALDGIRQALTVYIDETKTRQLEQTIASATSYLRGHRDFDAFDRAEFIKVYADPLTIELSRLEKSLQIRPATYNRLLNQQATTLFDTGAYNVNAYVPTLSAFATSDKIALGQKLFSDPLLSRNNMRSCSSCHQPERAFTDGLVKNTVIGTRDALGRNTPTLINASLQPSQFYDGRVKTLEDQSHSVIESVKEMHGSLSISVHRLWQDSAYRSLFSKAFPERSRSGIDTLEVMNALGSYIRSLTALNSRFDQYMRGDARALTKQELNGFNLFMGKAKCGTCHYMPLFNGSPPPRYMKLETEVIGVPAALHSKTIDPDPGRFRVIGHPSLLHAFKTPTVRNASRTAPYMHNGVFQTLGQVIHFYNNGGGAGAGITVSNQTLSSEPLHLTAQEQLDIVAFIHSLDSAPGQEN